MARSRFRQFLNFTMMIVITLIIIPNISFAFETEYDKGKGIENLSWCTDPGRAKSKLSEKNLNKCGDELIKHGNKSENELGLSAIKEICLGHDDIARALIRACQCHNIAGYNAVLDDWPVVVEWAKRHPYCEQWANWVQQATDCRNNGNLWDDDRQVCNVSNIGAQVDASCIQRRVADFNKTQTIVQVGNSCGQCVVVRWQKTLNGTSEFGIFEDHRVDANGAFNITMQTAAPGVHDIAILAAFRCK
jgi:hypothetical protein